MFAGFAILLPLLILFFFPEESSNANYFILPGVFTVLAGYLASKFFIDERKEGMKKNDEAAVIFIGWLSVISAFSLPFFFSGEYSVSQSIFEAASGLSTTGLTIADPESLPKIFLIYRSIMLFLGAIAYVTVVTSILPDTYCMRVYAAGGHSDLFVPKLTKSLQTAIFIYSGYTAAGAVLYYLCGMELFDSLNHAMSAVSTGGLSTKAGSIGYYNDLRIELITEVLMILGATGFLVHMMMLKTRFSVLLKHCEIRFAALIISLCTPLCAFLMPGGLFENMPLAFRRSLFQVISAVTTTGFQTVSSFENMSPPLMLIFTLLMLVGGGGGSAAGGIKQFRVWIMLKQVLWWLESKFSNRHIVRINTIERAGVREIVGQDCLNDVNVFIIIYILLFLTGSFALMLCGYGFGASMFEFASAMGTAGFSAGIVSPSAPSVVLWISATGMIIGRLEIYVVLMAVLRTTSVIKIQSGR